MSADHRRQLGELTERHRREIEEAEERMRHVHKASEQGYVQRIVSLTRAVLQFIIIGLLLESTTNFRVVLAGLHQESFLKIFLVGQTDRLDRC